MFELTENESLKLWYRTRADAIKERVTAYDVLCHFGTDIGSDNRPVQMSCPFHGEDSKPSARYHPASDTQHSHVWCFVCREQWDAIALWQKFTGSTFAASLRSMESNFGMEVPPAPKFAKVSRSEEDRKVLEKKLELCENRLLRALPAYKRLGAMGPYLAAGSVLDIIYSRLQASKMDLDEANRLADLVLTKVREKERSVLLSS